MRIKRFFKIFLTTIIFITLILFLYLFVGKVSPAKKITWGVTFSQKHSHDLGLDWRENYLAILDDLGVKNIRLIAYWDLLEPQNGQYNFEDLDWQVKEASSRGVKTSLVIGIKVPRWPECHVPEWAKGFNKEQQQEGVLALDKEIVLRCKDYPNIDYWQVENEPFFPFGNCPWFDFGFIKKEIRYVKSLDPSRQILITESGEWSPWVLAGALGDKVGTTMYQKIYFSQLKRYVDYKLPPIFYWRKAQVVKKLFGKEVITIELQAEPWGPKLIYDTSLKEQAKTMNLQQFKKNIEFAKNTGLREFSLWGVEWWYWMKTKHSNPDIWDEAKTLFVDH